MAPLSQVQSGWSLLARGLALVGGGTWRKTYDLASLEAFALAELVALTALSSRSARYVSENHWPSSAHGFLLVPVAAALLVRLAVPFLTRSAPSKARLALWTVRLRPALVAWALPPLLVRGAFHDNEPFLLLLTAAVVVGLEGSLHRSLPSLGLERWASWVRPLTRAWAPGGLLALLVTATFAFACYGSLRVHHKMLTSNLDLGLFENLFWNTLHGRHGMALGHQYFGEHAEFLLYALLPVYALIPRAETLLVLQAFFIVGAAVPLYLLGARWLRSPWQALVLSAVYLAFPSVHGSLFYDFHFLPLSAFFVLWAAFFYAKRRFFLLALAVVLAAACREDVALGLGAVGSGLLLLGRSRRLGLALAVFGFTWFSVVKLVWMERFGNQAFADYYAALLAPDTHGFGGVLQTLLANPLYAAGRTLTTEKALLALHLLTPLAFLAIRQRRTWVLLLPGLLVVGLSTNRSAITEFQFHYAMHFVPYLFIAAVIALSVRPRAFRAPVLTAMAVGALVSTVQFGAFFGPTFHASFQEVSFDWTRADARRAKAFASLAGQIPPDATLAAGEYEGPQLARRRKLVAVKEGLRELTYVIYSKRSLRWGGDKILRAALKHGSYGVVDSAEDLVLLRRDADTQGNASAIRQLD